MIQPAVHSLPRYWLSSCRQENLARGGNFPVQLPRVVRHGRGEGFLIAGYFQVRWYSPRVPATAASSKRHRTVGDLLAGRVGDGHGRMQRRIPGNADRLALFVRSRPRPRLILQVIQASDHHAEFRFQHKSLDRNLVSRPVNVAFRGTGERNRRLVGEIQNERFVLSDLDAEGASR